MLDSRDWRNNKHIESNVLYSIPTELIGSRQQILDIVEDLKTELLREYNFVFLVDGQRLRLRDEIPDICVFCLHLSPGVRTHIADLPMLHSGIPQLVIRNLYVA